MSRGTVADPGAAGAPCPYYRSAYLHLRFAFPASYSTPHP